MSTKRVVVALGAEGSNLRGHLVSEGYDAALAVNAEEAALQVAEWPDAVILDLALPWSWEVLRTFRAATPAHRVPVLLLVTLPYQGIRGLVEGAADFVEKPAGPITVMNRLEGVVAGQCRDIPGPFTTLTDISELPTLLAREEDAHPLLFVDDSAQYVEANHAACTLTGFSRRELLCMSVWDLTDVSHRTTGQELWRSFLERGEQEGSYVLKHKTEGQIDVSYASVTNFVPGVHLARLGRLCRQEHLNRADG